MEEDRAGSPVADCACCARCFDSVPDLLDHVEASHLNQLGDAA